MQLYLGGQRNGNESKYTKTKSFSKQLMMEFIPLQESDSSHRVERKLTYCDMSSQSNYYFLTMKQ
jgi:hypothetical protein